MMVLECLCDIIVGVMLNRRGLNELLCVVSLCEAELNLDSVRPVVQVRSGLKALAQVLDQYLWLSSGRRGDEVLWEVFQVHRPVHTNTTEHTSSVTTQVVYS